MLDFASPWAFPEYDPPLTEVKTAYQRPEEVLNSDVKARSGGRLQNEKACFVPFHPLDASGGNAFRGYQSGGYQSG
jgi:hypothetical protein